MKTKRRKQQINETKTYFLEKIKKIDKILVKLSKRREEKAQINKIRGKGGYYKRYQ
jgi:hypothetical protein